LPFDGGSKSAIARSESCSGKKSLIPLEQVGIGSGVIGARLSHRLLEQYHHLGTQRAALRLGALVQLVVQIFRHVTHMETGHSLSFPLPP